MRSVTLSTPDLVDSDITVTATRPAIPRRRPERLSFAKISEPLRIEDLDLVGIQRESFVWLTDHGLGEVFEEISPIEDFTGQMALSFSEHRFDQPKYSFEECKEKDLTFAAPLFVTAEFVNRSTGEIKSQTVFMGDFPDDDRWRHLRDQRD